MKKYVLLVLSITVMATPVFADWKLKQKSKIRGQEMGHVSTIWQKGVRQRREDKIDMGTEADDPEMAAMMAQMGQNMPTIPVHVSQCDLKQDVFINEKTHAYFVDYYDWSTVPLEKLKRRPAQKMVIKGTATSDTVVTDSGRRQNMFGMSARWLKVVQTLEMSADSCDGASSMRMEQEGWFVNLSLDGESCPVPPPQPNSGGCRPRMIVKRFQNTGVMLTGTMTVKNGNDTTAFETETLELSKVTLDPALFEIPKDYTEVDSQEELMSKRVAVDTSAKTVYSGQSDGPKSSVKTVAIDFFSGSASKLDQNDLRGYLSGKVTAAGMSGFPINSQSELSSGTFSNVIGVEIKKVKESGAAKVGGLFGKVITGGDSGAAIGTSSAEIIVTIYGNDGKTVVASSPASAEVKGKGSDAVKAAIDQVIGGLLSRIK